jgi:hypothetical protein
VRDYLCNSLDQISSWTAQFLFDQVNLINGTSLTITWPNFFKFEQIIIKDPNPLNTCMKTWMQQPYTAH